MRHEKENDSSAGLAAVGNDTGTSATDAREQAIDDLRVAWSPDIDSFSREECEDRLQKLIHVVAEDTRHEMTKDFARSGQPQPSISGPDPRGDDSGGSIRDRIVAKGEQQFDLEDEHDPGIQRISLAAAREAILIAKEQMQAIGVLFAPRNVIDDLLAELTGGNQLTNATASGDNRGSAAPKSHSHSEIPDRAGTDRSAPPRRERLNSERSAGEALSHSPLPDAPETPSSSTKTAKESQ